MSQLSRLQWSIKCVTSNKKLCQLRLPVTLVPCQANSTETSGLIKKEQLFYEPEVQTLLQKLTGLDYTKIFRMRKEGNRTGKPIYQFMTQEELENAQQETEQKAREKLQMPPVMDERLPHGRMLEADENLIGFDTSKYVFTDITFGVSDRERLIVVREPDGTLRTANWDEQDRLNQTYFPREGRKYRVPAMFEPEQLQEVLGPQKYEYILDRNCIQFEPDHPIYIRTAEAVYEHVDQAKNYPSLYSTRHYGPFVFYLCLNKRVDDLIVYNIQRKEMETAADLIKVYMKINKDAKLNHASLSDNTSSEDLIKEFAKQDAVKGDKILMALGKSKEI